LVKEQQATAPEFVISQVVPALKKVNEAIAALPATNFKPPSQTTGLAPELSDPTLLSSGVATQGVPGQLNLTPDNSVRDLFGNPLAQPQVAVNPVDYDLNDPAQLGELGRHIDMSLRHAHSIGDTKTVDHLLNLGSQIMDKLATGFGTQDVHQQVAGVPGQQQSLFDERNQPTYGANPDLPAEVATPATTKIGTLRNRIDEAFANGLLTPEQHQDLYNTLDGGSRYTARAAKELAALLAQPKEAVDGGIRPVEPVTAQGSTQAHPDVRRGVEAAMPTGATGIDDGSITPVARTDTLAPQVQPVAAPVAPTVNPKLPPPGSEGDWGTVKVPVYDADKKQFVTEERNAAEALDAIESDLNILKQFLACLSR
jgi:hypothetical protein